MQRDSNTILDPGREESKENGSEKASGGASMPARVCLFSLRVLLLSIAVPLVAFTGILLGYHLFSAEGLSPLERFWEAFASIGVDVSFKQTVYIALGTISVGLTLALVRELISSIPHIYEFLAYENKQKARKALFLTVATSFVFSFGVVVCALSYSQYSQLKADRESTPPALRPEARLNVMLAGGNRAEEEDAAGALSFLIMFYDDATAETVERGQGVGLEIPQDQAAMLRHIAEMASACSTGRAQRAALQVIGSASSEPFDELVMRKSNEYNRRLANLRARQVARSVAAYARDFVEKRNETGAALWEPELTTHAWATYEDMVRARRYNDRNPDGSYIDERARLTRSAEIRLLRAGGCEFQALTESFIAMENPRQPRAWASR